MIQGKEAKMAQRVSKVPLVKWGNVVILVERVSKERRAKMVQLVSVEEMEKEVKLAQTAQVELQALKVQLVLRVTLV